MKIHKKKLIYSIIQTLFRLVFPSYLSLLIYGAKMVLLEKKIGIKDDFFQFWFTLAEDKINQHMILTLSLNAYFIK